MKVPVRAVGIDLGASSSRVGILKNGKVEVITNSCGRNSTPSFVAFNQNERLIGDEARNQVTLNPTNTVFNSKRLIGKPFSDIHLQDDMTHWPFKVVKEGAHPSIEIDSLDEAKRFAPEEIHAMVLQKIKDVAGDYLGDEVTHAVISVPACFNDAQRQATRDAGIIAGFTDIKLINEPTATAIAYYFCHNPECNESAKNLLIFDLGGGKLDVSIVRVSSADIQVMATSGNTSLGGEDFDNRLMGHFAGEFRRKYHKEVSTNDRALARLRCASEKAKETLSVCKEAGVEIDMLCDGVDFCTHITRARFEELCMDLFRSAIESARGAVQLCGLDPTRIDEILLVGGSARIPKIQQLLQQAFPGVRMRCSDDLQQPVACGAAIQAAMLCEQIPLLKDLRIQDVTPYALKFENSDGSVSRICEPCTPIPFQKTTPLPWLPEANNPLMIKVIEGCENHIGDFQIVNLPCDKHCVTPKLEITFSIDAEGILGVSATDRSGETARKVAVKSNKHGFLPKEIESMRQDAEFYQTEDNLRKEQMEARNQLEAFVFSLKQAAEYAPPDRVNPLERQQVLETCKQVLEWLDGNEFTETDEFLFTFRHTQKQLESIMLKLQGSIPQDLSFQSVQRCRPLPTFLRNSLLNGHSHSASLNTEDS